MRLLQKEHLLIFQSTLPDPRSRAQVTAIARFQSTLPAWGETTAFLDNPNALTISIHSPRMGRDGTPAGTLPGPWNFNPLSPHGERPRPITIKTTTADFNPLSPHGERPSPTGGARRTAKFQSTLPAWGETKAVIYARYSSEFQSTLPAWGETVVAVHGVGHRVISIHSPRMGRDVSMLLMAQGMTDFNPLSPHGERPQAAGTRGAERPFQSTLPERGET